MAQTERIITRSDDNILNRAAAWFNSLFSRAKTWWVNIGTREVLADINSQSAITDGYNANAAVFSIIETDAEKFASIPRYVADAKKLEEKRAKIPLQFKALIKAEAKLVESTKPTLDRLLKRPNPYQGQAAFLKTVRSYYKACGEAFVWLNRGDVEGLSDTEIALLPILEMYPLPSYRMKIVPDDDPGIRGMWGAAGYILDANGQNIPFRKGEIIHWRGTNLLFDITTREHLRGMPALKPGSSTLQQNNDATHSSIRMYQNDGSRAAIYNKTLDKMTPTQETAIRSVIDRKFNNNDVKGAVAALQGEWGILDLSKSAVDLDLLEGKRLSFQELCALFGPPYHLFNPSVTRDNLEYSQKYWVSNKIIPASTEFDDELNRVLLRAFALEGKYIIQCDYSQLPEMQDDMASLTDWLFKAYWITPNEKREIQGYEKLSDELMNEPWVPSGYRPLSQMDGDGFDAMLNELGVQGANDYEKPVPAKD